MAAPNRRSLITAAAAFVGGAAIAGPAVAAVSSPAAVDPIPGLVAERNRLWAMEWHDDDKKTDELTAHVNVLENRIADTVAVSSAGLIAQLELLRFYIEEPFNIRLCDTINAGIKRRGGAA